MENIYVIIRTTSEEPNVGFAIKAFDCRVDATAFMATLANKIFEKCEAGDKTIEMDEDAVQIEWDDASEFDWMSIDKVEFVRSPDDAT